MILAVTSSAFKKGQAQSELSEIIPGLVGAVAACSGVISSAAAVTSLIDWRYDFFRRRLASMATPTSHKDLEDLESEEDGFAAMRLCGPSAMLKPSIYFSYFATALAAVMIVGGYGFGFLTLALDAPIVLGLISIQFIIPWAASSLLKATTEGSYCGV